jgi:hypothetical protein
MTSAGSTSSNLQPRNGKWQTTRELYAEEDAVGGKVRGHESTFHIRVHQDAKLCLSGRSDRSASTEGI